MRTRTRHGLHPRTITSDALRARVARAFAAIPPRPEPTSAAMVSLPGSFEIPLTTVSLDLNFDANIAPYFAGAPASSAIPMILDSGNSMLIVPRWEDIMSLPNSAANYQVLGTGQEPWGCPANIVRGPINLATADNEVYTIDNCVFYACTADGPGDGPGGARTANFGAGCLSPWSASDWNTPAGLATPMQAPLSYNSTYPYVEFNYAAAEQIHGPAGVPNVQTGSSLTLYQSMPTGYQMFNVTRNCEWMSLAPMSLSIGATKTAWPGPAGPPIAMIDTGGGPVFLSDPDGSVYSTAWPDPAANPSWTSGSTNCESTSDALTIEIGDGTGSYTYTLNPSSWPVSVQGLTLVMCQMNEYMMGQRGMNLGGISVLQNSILVDFTNARVGFKTK